MNAHAKAGRALALSLLGTALVLVATLGPIDSASACDAEGQHSFGVSPGCFDLQISGVPNVTNAAPDFTQAGGHPYDLTTTIRLNAPSEEDPVHGQHWPPEPLKDLRIQFPPGVVANFSAVSTCTRSELADGDFESSPACPPSSQVGVVEVELVGFVGIATLKGVPLYMVDPSPGAAASLGFNFLGVPAVFDAGLKPGTNDGLVIEDDDVSQTLALVGLSTILWGVPADSAHTPQRACPGESPPTEPGGATCAAGVPPRAFFSMPSICAGPLTATVRYDSWENPGAFGTTSVVTHLAPGLRGDPTETSNYPVEYPGLDEAQWGAPQGMTGCDQLPFDPSMSVQPTTHSAGSPTGLDIRLGMPHNEGLDPAAVAESDLRSVTVDLPRGLAINPAVANGLTGCTQAEVALESSEPSVCPPSSKLGTVAVESPLLDGQVSGSIYAAADGGGGASLPVYLVAEGTGIAFKLAGEVHAGGSNGRLTTTFDDLPQLPLSGIELSFFAGERAPFVNPSDCGSHASDGHFVPWSGGPEVDLETTFDITSGLNGAGCTAGAAQPFSPTFSAGSTNPLANATSSFVLRVRRKSSEQELAGLDVTLPSGLVASLGGVPLCSESELGAAATESGVTELASPSCSASSQVGHVTASAGAGSEPLTLGGKLFLAGPYEGAPFSLAALVPVVAGPLDLDTMVLRFSLRVDPTNGRVEIGSALPTTQEGVDLRLQSIAVDIDRPGFIRNPTGCAPTAVAGKLAGTGGAIADVASRFQVRGCGSLPFKPALKMRFLGGGSATRHAAHPGLRAVIESRSGDASVGGMAVTLPGAEQLDLAHIREVCREADLAADSCPDASSYGSVEIASPIVAGPLTGKIYLVASRHRFPDLVAIVHGSLEFRLRGRLTFDRGLVRLVFDSLPDLPSSRIALDLNGGHRGLFVNNRNLCPARPLADARLSGHNGKAVVLRGMAIRLPPCAGH